MSYACGYIVYGYVFDKQSEVEVLESIEYDENIADEQYKELEEFIEVPYNGGGGSFGYVGKVIKCVDECANYNMADITSFVVTPELKSEIDEMLDKSPDYIKNMCVNRGLFLTWGSS